MKDKLVGAGKGIADFFINLSAEYTGALTFITWAAAFVGVLLVASSVFEFVRVGRAPNMMQEKGSWQSITSKNVGGVFLMSFVWSVEMFSSTIWMDNDPLNLAKYDVSASTGDYSEAAIAAATGFIILTGAVVLFRAYLGIAKLGGVPEQQRGDQWGYVLSRLVAGSALVCAPTVVSLISSYKGG